MLKECYESEVQGLYKLIKESSPNMGRSSLNQRASERLFRWSERMWCRKSIPDRDRVLMAGREVGEHEELRSIESEDNKGVSDEQNYECDK